MCGTEQGPQLNFENLDSKNVASFIYRQNKYVYDTKDLCRKLGPKFAELETRDAQKGVL